MPKHWPLVPLGEIASPVARPVSPVPGSVYRQIGVKWWGLGVYEREPIDGAGTQYKTLYRLQPGEIIINKIWARHGSVAVVQGEMAGCYASGEFPMFSPAPEKLYPRWFHWFTKTRDCWEQCDEKSRGTSGKNRIRPEVFLEIKIPLPPLDEKRRIVARIEQLAAKIQEARDLCQQSQEQVQHLYPAQLALCMETHGQGWKRETVGNVILSMDAGWSPQCDDVPARKGEWGVLKTTSVQWCEFRPHENKVLPPGLEPIPELAAREGDVLVTRAGPRKRVGVVAAVRESEPQLTISDKLIRLRPDRAKIDPRFLELSLASPFSQEHLVRRKTGLADAQVNISQAILRATPIAYPPLPEQRRIVVYLDGLQAKVDALKKLQAETAAELDALMPSILDRAFRG